MVADMNETAVETPMVIYEKGDAITLRVPWAGSPVKPGTIGVVTSVGGQHVEATFPNGISLILHKSRIRKGF